MRSERGNIKECNKYPRAILNIRGRGRGWGGRRGSPVHFLFIIQKNGKSTRA